MALGASGAASLVAATQVVLGLLTMNLPCVGPTNAGHGAQPGLVGSGCSAKVTSVE
jgi:hypothetical protein